MESTTSPRASRPTRSRARAPVLEVFASIQGEGRYVGEPQVFVRLEGCPLRCRWCDTPASWVQRHAPSSVEEVVARVRAAEGARPRTVSITGGEPLVHPGFVRALAEALAPRRVHLETGGGHPGALAEVRDAVHHVSLDLKLARDLDPPVELEAAPAEPAPGTNEAWRAARRRALVLVRGRDACGKLVLSRGSEPREIEQVLDDVRELAPELCVVLQPVTPMHGVLAPTRAEIEAAVEAARARELEVRVLPQVHRALRLP